MSDSPATDPLTPEFWTEAITNQIERMLEVLPQDRRASALLAIAAFALARVNVDDVLAEGRIQ